MGNVEYRPDKNGTAESVKCPLVDDWTDPADCMENQEVRDEAIPARFRQKPKAFIFNTSAMYCTLS